MSSASPIEKAIYRLNAAMERLESVVERRFDAGSRVAELESELQRVHLDRSRLAQSVDAAEARSDRIEEANQDVSRRLVTAMESIRTVLERQQGQG